MKDLLLQLEEKNIKISLKKSYPHGGDQFIYSLQLKERKTSAVQPRSARNTFGAPYSHLPKDHTLQAKVKLSLSGGQLMVQTGGGYKQLLEYLEQRGYFYGSHYAEI